MLADWTFGRRLAVAFTVAALVLCTIAGATYWSISGLISNDAWVTHTQQVRETLSRFLLDMASAESFQRGYLLTGQDTYIGTYDGSAKAAGDDLATFRQLTSDNPDQQTRASQMQTLMEQRLALLKKHVAAYKAGGLSEATQEISGAGGEDTMVALRSLVNEADQAEATLLVTRTTAAEQAANVATGVAIWGGLAGIVIIAVIGWFITRSLGRQIGAAVGHVQSSSAELQSAANQQATGVKEQVTSMNEINTTINELLATSRQIAESAQRVAQISEETTDAARSGDGTVERASESITGIRRQVDLVVGHMLELGKKSQQIGAVLDIVTELAEQTNILSINATIEAAGAGENGKRFAIVADEIRKLADRVAGSAKEIRALIDDVRSSVNTTVMATETGSKAVESGSKQFGDVATAFKQIAKLVLTTTEAAREIELSTKQQATAVEQVNSAIASVSQATRETEASAGQTIQTASELASTSRDLLRLVQASKATSAAA